MKNFPIILYFIANSAPTLDEMADAAQYGPGVRYRNARFVPETGSKEECHGVAGEVPKLYKECPTAEEAIEAFQKEMYEERRRVEDAAARVKEKSKLSKQSAKAAAPKKETEPEDPPKGDEKPATDPKAPAAAPAKGEWKAN